MLTPEQIEAASLGLSPIFEDLEDFVIRDLVRRLIAAEGKWTGTAQLQANSGVMVGVSIDDVIQAVARGMGLADAELAKILRNMGMINLLSENERLTGAGLSPIKIESLPFLQRIVEDIIIQTRGALHNLSGSTAIGIVRDTVGGRMYMGMQAYYRHVLDSAMLKVRAGVQSPMQAIRDAIKELAKNGLSMHFESGYNCGIDVAVRRALLTGINQMASIQNAQIADELGLPLAEVTAHQGARPSHAEWQGKVYQIKGSSKKYKNLAMATGLGTVSGLLGANCRHHWHGYDEGMPRTWSDEELKHIDPPDFDFAGKHYNAYGATQRQRALEREIRRKKRELIGYEAADDKEAFMIASKHLSDIRTEYEVFSNRADLRTKDERAQVFGYGRSISQKSVHAAKRYEEKIRKAAQERAIIEEIKNQTNLKGDIRLKAFYDIDIDHLRFNDLHINGDRKHGVSEMQAKNFIRDAKVFQRRMGGDALNYYSVEGVTYVRVGEGRIRTAFTADEFSDDIKT
ncbi:MAG: phage minor capsid protein, partial [Christensenellaceae bacterium]